MIFNIINGFTLNTFPYYFNLQTDLSLKSYWSTDYLNTDNKTMVLCLQMRVTSENGTSHVPRNHGLFLVDNLRSCLPSFLPSFLPVFLFLSDTFLFFSVRTVLSIYFDILIYATLSWRKAFSKNENEKWKVWM